MKDRWGKYSLLTGNEAPRRCFCCGREIDGNHRYCSQGCRDLYYLCFYWPVASWACRERSRGYCHDCGEHFPLHQIVAHHIIPLDGSPRTWNILNRPDNLVALCEPCHGKRHVAMDRRQPAKVVAALQKPSLIVEPICGWEWIEAHIARFPEGLPEQMMVIVYDGRELGVVRRDAKRSVVKSMMKGGGNND